MNVFGREKISLQVYFGIQRNCTESLVLWFVILKDILVRRKKTTHFSVSRHQQISQSNENHIQNINWYKAYLTLLVQSTQNNSCKLLLEQKKLWSPCTKVSNFRMFSPSYVPSDLIFSRKQNLLDVFSYLSPKAIVLCSHRTKVVWLWKVLMNTGVPAFCSQHAKSMAVPSLFFHTIGYKLHQRFPRKKKISRKCIYIFPNHTNTRKKKYIRQV